MKRLSILNAIFGLAIPQHVVSPVEIEISPVEFIHPTSHFYPMPFWHMNGELTRDGIIQQMTDANQVGFKGLAILPVVTCGVMTMDRKLLFGVRTTL